MATHDNAVWVRLLHGYGRAARKMAGHDLQVAISRVTAETRGTMRLVHPRNRKGRTEAEWLSTARLEATTAEYREAAELADKQAQALLGDLCAQLVPRLVTILAANELSVVVTALNSHVVRTRQAGWNWPAMPIVPPPSSSPPSLPSSAYRDVRLELPGLWPYWMEREAAVPNDVSLRAGKVALLTGPNMAGKSTVLRSIAAATLLATCGLSVPAVPRSHPSVGAAAAAAAASGNPGPVGSSNSSSGSSGAPGGGLEVSWVSHVSLRNFSGDSPLEGKSAFAVEVEDTAATLAVARTARRSCLVLLDELGKGTEVVAGSALAAAVVEDLAAAGVAGVFATHLHDLVFVLQPLCAAGRVQFWAMEVAKEEEAATAKAKQQPQQSQQQQQQAVLRPTRRVVVGQVCLRSLALQVARACGLQADVLARAAQHEAALGAMMLRARQRAYGAGAPGAEAAMRALQELAGAGLEQEEAEWLGPGAGEGRPAPRSPDPVDPSGLAASGSRLGDGDDGAEEASEGSGSGSGDGSGSGAESDGEDEAAAAAAEAEGGESGSDESGGDEAEVAVPPSPAAAQLRSDEELQEMLFRAADSMRDMLRARLAQVNYPLGPDTGKLTWVKPEYRAAKRHAAEAVVYVSLWWDATFYVGESEGIAERLRIHRGKETWERKARGKPLTTGKRNRTTLHLAYVVVPREAGGKSLAQDIESSLIRQLEAADYPMRSKHDMQRTKRQTTQLP